MVYILLLIITLALSLIDLTSINISYKRVFFLILAALCFLMAGLRFMTGGDYISYESIFLYTPSLSNFDLFESFNNDVEPGFLLINMFLKSITSNPQSVFITFSFLHMVLLYYIYKKHSKYFLISLALFIFNYFLLLTMGQLRQGTAYLIGILALTQAYEKNFIKFIFLFLLSLSFHTSAIVLLPIYFIANIKFKKMQILTVLIVSFVLAYQIGIIEIFITKGIQWGVITSYIDYYSQFTRYTSNSLPILGLLYRLLVLGILLYYREKLFKEDKRYNFLINMYFFGVVAFIALGEISLISNRVSRYFTIFETIAFPYILVNLKNTNKVILLIVIFVLGIYFYLDTIYLKNPESFLPYRIY